MNRIGFWRIGRSSQVWAVLALLLATVGLACSLLAAEAGNNSKAPVGATVTLTGGYVLLVSGTPGSAVYERRYQDWLNRLRAMFLKAGVAPERIRVLRSHSDAEAASRGTQMDAASAEGIRVAIAQIASRIKPSERFFLVLIGHGVSGEKPPTFVVPGVQPNAEELARWLDTVPAGQQVILNFTSSSGMFLSYLAKKGRINLSALAPVEGSEPVVAEFFLRGVESGRADENRDGVITLLETFNWSAWALAQWTNRQTQMGKFVFRGGKKVFLPRGDWKMDGRETVEIFHRLCDGDEGDPGARKLAPESNVRAPDMTVEIRPPRGILTSEWRQRRILGEHAFLEDCGAAPGVTPFLPWVPKADAPQERVDATLEGGVAIRGDSPEDRGFDAIKGERSGEPGGLARTVILGAATRK